MNDTLLQSMVWLLAGGLIVLFLKRRRTRKSER
jgi:hypothetical protein